jgi:protein TonB
MISLFAQMRDAVGENRARLHEFFWRQYDVEVEKPKEEVKPEPPPPEPPPVPEPAPAPKPQAMKPVEDDPYKNLPPTPAKAAAVITAAPKDNDKVEDMTDTVVTGDGTALGGMQSGRGQGDAITMRKASLQGTPGGTGSVAAKPPPAPVEDKSRAAMPVGGLAWNCPFPPEADADQIDRAVVGVQITVRADGSVGSVVVTSDPGHGFGRAAKNCANARQYKPALDRAGTAVLQSILVNVNFKR